MHYPDMGQEYEGALKVMSHAIKTARAGDYRKGYLGILLEGLAMMKTASHRVGRHGRDGAMLDSLISEFRGALEQDEKPEMESPLSELFPDEGEGYKERDDDDADTDATENPHHRQTQNPSRRLGR